MHCTHKVRRFLLASIVAVFAATGFAHAASKKEKAFEPQVGQEGKDVVWVPTSQALVNKMLDMAKLTANDVHYDLGSGDGRTVITAAKRGARAFGVEFNPDMVALSRRNAQKEGVAEKATFIHGDIFEVDFSKASVITLFLLPELNVKLRPKILDMKPGTRVVSNSFTMGDWQADRTMAVTEKEGCQTYCTAYLWIVPAKVEGKWKLPDGELVLTQTFQKVSGALARDGKNAQVSNGNVRADQVTFTLGGAQYSAKVDGDTMKGTIKSGGSSREFTASRIGS
ncbi:MAG TPA: class I SAM-dependent methyltransferase [Burkholderiales bacterium]|nr:class I SAM-dependent methyltransferase [Burkholderiales bacterium]